MYEREEWGGKFLNESRNYLEFPSTYHSINKSVKYVIFSTSPRCSDFEKCCNVARKSESLYNFLIDNDCKVYSLLGWDYYKPSRPYFGIYVSFLTGDTINKELVGTAMKLINYGLANNKISVNYSVLVMNQTSRNIDAEDVKNIYREIKTWPKFTPDTFYDPNEYILNFGNKRKIVTDAPIFIPEKNNITNFTILTKEEWGGLAGEPFPKGILKTPLSLVVFGQINVWCSGLKSCKMSLQKLQQNDINTKMGDIRYNFIIDSEGIIYFGRGWDNVVQPDAFYVAFPKWGSITDFQLDAANNLMLKGVALGKLDSNYSAISYAQFAGFSSADSVHDAVKLLPHYNPNVLPNKNRILFF